MTPNQSQEPTADGAFISAIAVHVASRRWLFSTLGHNHAMNNMRAFLMSFLLLAGTCVFSGCATTGHDTHPATTASKGVEKAQPSPTENMNAMEKSGYYLGWLSLDFLYSLAGSSPTFSP